MEGKIEKQALVRELPELSLSETRDGVHVRVRCVEITGSEGARGSSGSARYEIYMDADGISAVADVPAEDRAKLASRIDDFVSAFVDSVLLRASADATP
jgi:hypothetical protein